MSVYPDKQLAPWTSPAIPVDPAELCSAMCGPSPSTLIPKVLAVRRDHEVASAFALADAEGFSQQIDRLATLAALRPIRILAPEHLYHRPSLFARARVAHMDEAMAQGQWSEFDLGRSLGNVLAHDRVDLGRCMLASPYRLRAACVLFELQDGVDRSMIVRNLLQIGITPHKMLHEISRIRAPSKQSLSLEATLAINDGPMNAGLAAIRPDDFLDPVRAERVRDRAQSRLRLAAFAPSTGVVMGL